MSMSQPEGYVFCTLAQTRSPTSRCFSFMAVEVTMPASPGIDSWILSATIVRFGRSTFLAVVFGVSMGGDVALNLALEHRQLVAGLVLIAPGGLVPILRNPVVQFSAWLVAQAPDWLLLPTFRLANCFAGMALRTMVKNLARLPPQVIDDFVHEARRPGGGIAYGRYNQATLGRSVMLNDLTEQVQGITVPTLFFHGEDDPMVDPRGSRRAAARMPAARLVMVPDCGHWAQLEAHDRFLDEAKAFLTKF
jgi:pimeloyl-ACP methyl ester carboxylesterase